MVPLCFVEDGGDRIVVATNWGRPAMPEWALNLLHTPEATIEIGTESRVVRAERLPAEVQDRLWPAFDDMLPAYRSYRSRLERGVPMYRLVE